MSYIIDRNTFNYRQMCAFLWGIIVTMKEFKLNIVIIQKNYSTLSALLLNDCQWLQGFFLYILHSHKYIYTCTYTYIIKENRYYVTSQ